MAGSRDIVCITVNATTAVVAAFLDNKEVNAAPPLVAAVAGSLGSHQTSTQIRQK